MNHNKMCAILSNITKYDQLSPLTDERPVATLPFDCKYRLIDFPLSSISNAGIHNVLMVFNQGETQSVFDHLSSGKEWGMDTLQSHFFIYIAQDFERQVQKNLSYFTQQIKFLKKSKAPYTVLIGSKIICNVDLQAVLKIHQEQGKPVTAVYKKVSTKELDKLDTVLRFQENNQVSGHFLKDLPDYADKENLSLNIFIVDTEWLIDFLENTQKNEQFISISRLLRDNLTKIDVNTYEYVGYMSNVFDIYSYYKANMAMLDGNNFSSLLLSQQPIYTKIKNEVPTYYSKDSHVHSSQVGSGCTIEGTVLNSLIFRGVQIEKHAVINQSLVFPGTVIKNNVELEYVIVDKDVIIEPNVKLSGTAEKPLVIPKNSHIKKNSEIEANK